MCSGACPSEVMVSWRVCPIHSAAKVLSVVAGVRSVVKVFLLMGVSSRCQS